MRLTPSLPQRGRQPKWSFPVTPYLYFLYLKKRILGNQSPEGYYIFMDAKAGTKAKVPAARKSFRTFSDDFYNDKILIKNFGYSHNLTTDIEIDL
jgi:hypothetical protein